jgi:ESX secretion system protein EccE
MTAPNQPYARTPAPSPTLNPSSPLTPTLTSQSPYSQPSQPPPSHSHQPRLLVAARPPRDEEVKLLPVRGPRHERHLLTADELNALSLPVGDDGVVIGTDPNNQPAVLGLFRPRPVDAALVGGSYLAQLIALRAVATGARIVIETARPELWAALAQNAGGGQPVVAIVPVRRVGALGASAASPVLLIRDCGARPPRLAQPKTPWQTTLTLLPFLDPAYAAQLAGADLVALQRISPQESQLAGRVIRLGVEDVQALPGLPDELTLWSARHGRQYVYSMPSQLEAGLLGTPRRVD